MSHINVAQHEQYEQQVNQHTVTVKLKKGDWEIEITCKEDNVKQVVESVLAGMNTTDEKKNVKTIEKKGHATCKSLIEDLWRENWFVYEHTLSEVHEELSRKGYNYDKSAVSHALTDLVKEGVLTRIGSIRVYRYIQKKPSL